MVELMETRRFKIMAAVVAAVVLIGLFLAVHHVRYEQQSAFIIKQAQESAIRQSIAAERIEQAAIERERSI